jgi:hypothetical protein
MRLNNVLLDERRWYENAAITTEAWLTDQIDFLESHHFFTDPAIDSRQDGKLKNLALMRAALAGLNSAGPSPLKAH